MIELDIQPRKKKVNAPEADNTFRILLMGDFGAADLTRPQVIDRDNFEEVMEKLKVSIDHPLAGKISFREIDDFHPDQLFRNLSLFRTLRETRDRLEDPDTFSETRAQIYDAPTPQAGMEILRPVSLLDDIVETSTGGKSVDPFSDYLRKLVGPYTQPKPDPKLYEMLAEVDAAVAGNMRDIIHFPAFQRLEAAWRSVYFLTREIETSVDLKIYLMHLPQQAVAGELLSATNLQNTVLHSLFKLHPWNFIAADFYFSPNDTDMGVLGRIALLAGATNVRFLAAAEPKVEQWLEPAAGYQEVRTLPEAASVGLALPRWIARMPYGKGAGEVDLFDFQELPLRGAAPHEQYCWANPAFAVAYLVAQDHATGEEALNIHRLPAHVYKDGAESVVKPCAEFWMTTKNAEELISHGLMPLVSMKGQDWIRLAGMRAINGGPLVD